MDDEFLTIKQTAAFLKLGVSTINRYIKQGKIPSYKIEGNRLFQKSEIIQWVKQQGSQPVRPPTSPQSQDDDDQHPIVLSLE
jgi:excisionase family DNA binding protein